MLISGGAYLSAVGISIPLYFPFYVIIIYIAIPNCSYLLLLNCYFLIVVPDCDSGWAELLSLTSTAWSGDMIRGLINGLASGPTGQVILIFIGLWFSWSVLIFCYNENGMLNWQRCLCWLKFIPHLDYWNMLPWNLLL